MVIRCEFCGIEITDSVLNKNSPDSNLYVCKVCFNKKITVETLKRRLKDV